MLTEVSFFARVVYYFKKILQECKNVMETGTMIIQCMKQPRKAFYFGRAITENANHARNWRKRRN